MIRRLHHARTWLALAVLALAAACGPQQTGGGAGGAPTAGSAAPGGMAEVLALHNSFRAAHCAPPLAWSDQLARTAQAWAERCSFSHSGNNLGENIAYGTAGAYSPKFFVENWYSEVSSYDFARGGSRDGQTVGHFTQIVWADSAQLGCGWANCGGQDYLVCNYSPPGNYSGRHTANVRPRC